MGEVKTVPARSEVRKEDTWALEDMYADRQAWETAFAGAKELAEQAASYAGKLGESAENLFDYCRLDEELECVLSEVYGLSLIHIWGGVRYEK